jgi:uncharacterized repeat protein (TIGR02543 family)
MQNAAISQSSSRLLIALAPALIVAAVLLEPEFANAQWATLANPNWNITLTDYGYSDFLLDNTPGFEGREYLSGEWGAAVAYQVAGGTNVAPMWFEPQFVFPDWTTHSTFHVVSPITQTGVNADNLPIAQSVIANAHVEVTLRFEMLDTVVGTPMGTVPASATNAPAFRRSNRYVMKQTCTIRNISGTPLSNVQLFHFLHGLNSQRGVFDDRPYDGQLGAFHYDTTLAGVDPWSVGAGSSSAGLEDYIAFHAAVPPDALEIGHYGIEGNGVDNHGIGKPSDGVHLSIENNWQSAPYNAREGRDHFAPPTPWIAGAQRWTLGSLGVNQSVSHDVLLSILTGTRVTSGVNSSGSCNGGSSAPGGLDYEFEDVSSGGSCFASFSKADDDELVIRIAQGEFDEFTFPTPGKPAQVWEVEFSGSYTGAVTLTFGYDPTALPAGFNEGTLAIYHFEDGAWVKLGGSVNALANTITISADTLGAFALGCGSGTLYTINAGAAPAVGGSVTGAGSYSGGSSATLTATANTGYAFVNWTEGGSPVSTSPNLTFTVNSNRALVANFVSAGGDKVVTTASTPVNGGTTSGGGVYAAGVSATVSAAAAPGYKFSKWLRNGASVATTPNYTFTVTSNVTLTAKFKPVFTMSVSAVPVNGGEVEADPVYEAGEIAKLKAKPNAGWCFVNWTQNGAPVSTDPNFTFTVTANRVLEGHFAQGHRIDAGAQPANAGSVSGGGVHSHNAPVSLQAVAKEGYIFVNWTEGTNPVSNSATLNFTSTSNRVLVANFIALPKVIPSATTPGALIVTWPAGAAGWVLQEATSLTPPNWTNSTAPITVVDGMNRVTVHPPEGARFFRLAHP